MQIQIGAHRIILGIFPHSHAGTVATTEEEKRIQVGRQEEPQASLFPRDVVESDLKARIVHSRMLHVGAFSGKTRVVVMIVARDWGERAGLCVLVPEHQKASCRSYLAYRQYEHVGNMG